MRAFVAVDVSGEGVLESISKFQVQTGINARAVNPHNMHFTLQFLGEVQTDVVGQIREALKKIKFSSFMVNFRGVGAFPGPRFPRIIWIGTDKGSKELQNLAGKVEERLAPLGFSSDKPFKPHITVFRIKRPENVKGLLERFRTSEFGSQQVASIKLKQSVLGPGGAAYSDLEEVRATQ